MANTSFDKYITTERAISEKQREIATLRQQVENFNQRFRAQVDTTVIEEYENAKRRLASAEAEIGGLQNEQETNKNSILAFVQQFPDAQIVVRDRDARVAPTAFEIDQERRTIRLVAAM